MIRAAERTGLDFVFARHEIKFLVPGERFPELMRKLDGMLVPDLYPESHILSIYYDTKNDDLISRSLAGGPYKEKLRLRSYGVPDRNTMVFPELKKKYRGVVYKRRAAMPLREAEIFLERGILAGRDGQIVREIAYFRDFYRPQPKLFIGYDRKSFAGSGQSDLRVTFDRNIRWRSDRLSLAAGDDGTPLDLGDRLIMEVKAEDAVPLGLARTLSSLGIYPEGFSKYGTIYTMLHQSEAAPQAAEASPARTAGAYA